MNTPTRHGLLIGVATSIWFGFAGALLVVSASLEESLNVFPIGVLLGAAGLIPMYSGSEDYEPRHRKFLIATVASLAALAGLFAAGESLLARAAELVAAGDPGFRGPATLGQLLVIAGGMIFGLPFVLPVYHIFEVEERRLLRATLVVFFVAGAIVYSISAWLAIDSFSRTEALINSGAPATDYWTSARSRITLAEGPIFLMLLPFSAIFVRAFLKAKRLGQARIDDIFIIANDGRLMNHAARRLEPNMDFDILAGMFKAVLDFMKESFAKKVDRAITGFEMGDYFIAVGHGQHVTVALACRGVPHDLLRQRLTRVLKAAEGHHQGSIEKWDGRRETVREFVQEVVSGMQLARIL